MANSAFTDTEAHYAVVSPGRAYVRIYHVNQNTAPSGWYGTKFSGPSGRTVTQGLVLGPHKGTAGSDMTRATFSSGSSLRANAAAADSAEVVDTGACCGAITSAIDPAATAIQRKMLDAPNHYRDVAGSFRIIFRNIGQADTVDFQVSEAQARSLSRCTDTFGHVEEHAVSGTSETTRCPEQLRFASHQLLAVPDTSLLDDVTFAPRSASLASMPRVDAPRFYRDGTCKPVYVVTQDAAQTNWRMTLPRRRTTRSGCTPRPAASSDMR